MTFNSDKNKTLGNSDLFMILMQQILYDIQFVDIIHKFFMIINDNLFKKIPNRITILLLLQSNVFLLMK